MSTINKPLPHRPFSLALAGNPERPPRRQHQPQVRLQYLLDISLPSFLITNLFGTSDVIRIEPSTLRAGQRQARHLRRPRSQADAFGDSLAVSHVLPRRLGRPSVIETQTIPLVLRITFPINPQPVNLRFHLSPRSPTLKAAIPYRFVLAPPLVRYPHFHPRCPWHLHRCHRRSSRSTLRWSAHPFCHRVVDYI